MTILVAEDSRTQARLLERSLEQAGYRVAVAENGEAAMAVLARQRPSLVISDILMPVMDGYELCRRIKADPAYCDIPVMLLTTLSDSTDVIRGLEAGADAFATKPYKEPTLLRRVQSILVNRAMREQDAGSAAGGVFFAGRRRAITARSQQTVEFLLYTYEDAVEKNSDLMEARDALARLNRDLESYAAQLREKNAQMIDDLRMASEIQQAFLPRAVPHFPPTASESQSCVRVAHVYAPSTTLGGDFFDVLSVSDTEAGVFVCDVVGHGLRAALVTAIIRGLVEDLAPVAGEPGRFLTELNRSLAAVFTRSDDPVFASAVYGVIDVTTGEIRLANAGHPCPLHLRRASNAVAPVRLEPEDRGPALGLFADQVYSTCRGRLAVGDVVVFFTDGVFEAQGPGQEEYGERRLETALLCHSGLPPGQMLDALLADVRRFAGAAEFVDDVCLVAVELARLEERHV